MKKLTNQQEMFLGYLFDRGSPYRGKPNDAALAAGYSESGVGRVVRALRDEIRNRTLDSLTGASINAADQLMESLTEDGTTPKADIRLKAAESILDRVGLGKQQTIDVTNSDESMSPLFILPAKKQVKVDENYDGVDIS